MAEQIIDRYNEIVENAEAYTNATEAGGRNRIANRGTRFIIAFEKPVFKTDKGEVEVGEKFNNAVKTHVSTFSPSLGGISAEIIQTMVRDSRTNLKDDAAVFWVWNYYFNKIKTQKEMHHPWLDASVKRGEHPDWWVGDDVVRVSGKRTKTGND